MQKSDIFIFWIEVSFQTFCTSLFNSNNFIVPLGAIPEHTEQFIERENTKAHIINLIKY